MATVILVVVAVVGLFFGGMGIYALTAPQAMLRSFDYPLGTPTARAEARGVYGGFGLAIAGVLAYAAATPGEIRTGILITVGAALGGMAFGRLISAVFDGPTPFYPNWFYFLVEVVAAVALVSVALAGAA